MFPAITGFGAFVLVIERSAVVAKPTVVWTVAELLVKTGSDVPAVTLSISVITVPAATPVFTATATVKVVAAAFGTSGLVQEIAPVPPIAGATHVHLEPLGTFKDWKVVFAGTVSLKTALSESIGPLFVTLCV